MSTSGSLDETTVKRLIEESHKVKERAYAPYSNFRVGAALITEDGQIFTGCKVENAAYGLGQCAEKCAIGTAVAMGYKKYRAIAVASDLEDKVIVPCGGCRQVLAEFGLDWDVYLTRSDHSYELYTVSQLLPGAFQLDPNNNNNNNNNNKDTTDLSNQNK